MDGSTPIGLGLNNGRMVTPSYVPLFKDPSERKPRFPKVQRAFASQSADALTLAPQPRHHRTAMLIYKIIPLRY